MSGDHMSQLTERVKSNKNSQKKLKLSPKRGVNLLLSVLGNRGMAYQKLGNFGKAYEDSSFGIILHKTHVKEMGEFKISFAKLNYRRMLSLEGLLTKAQKQIRQSTNELLKVNMLENVLIYLVELLESCKIVEESEGRSISGNKAKKLKSTFSWMQNDYTELQKKKKENEELSKKIKRSMTDIEIPKEETKEEKLKVDIEKEESIASIAKKAMESLLESEELANNASDFQTKVESFKENHEFVCKYLFKYSSEKIQSLYSKRELEAAFMLRIINALDQCTKEEDLKEAGRLLEVIMDLPKSKLTFRMMIKSEKRGLKKLLEKVDKVREKPLLEEYHKRFRLPNN
jgi:hypothetical protein